MVGERAVPQGFVIFLFVDGPNSSLATTCCRHMDVGELWGSSGPPASKTACPIARVVLWTYACRRVVGYQRSARL